MLTLLSAARTMKWEDHVSKNGPTKEQLLGAIGLAQRDNPVGIAILSAKYMQCAHSTDKIHRYLKLQSFPLLTSIQRDHASYLLIADALDMPIDVMQKRIQGAWKRYSMRGERARKTIDTLKKAVKSMEKAMLLKTSAQEINQLDEQIAAHMARIESEERALHEYAATKASESGKCPRCRATGVVQKTQRHCDTCAGSGEFRVTEADWLKSLLVISDNDQIRFKDRWPQILLVLREKKAQLRGYELEALSALEKRLSAEYENPSD